MENPDSNELERSLERYRRLLESVTDYIYTVRIENGVSFPEIETCKK